MVTKIDYILPGQEDAHYNSEEYKLLNLHKRASHVSTAFKTVCFL